MKPAPRNGSLSVCVEVGSPIHRAVFCVVGAIVCLRRARRPAYPFLLSWAGAMLLPSIVSGVAPTFGRSIGSTLPLAIVVATGIEATWTATVERWPRRRTLATAIAVGALAFSAGITARDYFTVWAQTPDLPRIFHQDMATVGHYIGALPADAVVYITPSQKYYATLLVAMQQPKQRGEPVEGRQHSRMQDFYGPAGLLPAGDPAHEMVVLILEGDETTGSMLEATFPEGWWDVQNATFAAYRVPPGPDRVRPAHVLEADFADRIRLIGFDIQPPELHPGDTLTVKLTWQALEPMDRRYTAFVHLLGSRNPALGSPLWAQDDHEPGQATYSTDRWFQDEVTVDTFHLWIPADAPPGEYTLSTGFYELQTMERLPRSDAPGDTATLTTVVLTEQAP